MMVGASATAVAAIANCGTAEPMYGCCCPPPPNVTLESPCGFTVVTTTCAGTVAHQGTTDVSVDGITASCSINVTLGDGTAHTVAVTFGTTTPGGFCGSQTFQTVTSSNFVNVDSPTCTSPQDSGGPGDASQDTSSDSPPDALGAD